MKRFNIVYQHDAMDCGPACLAMLARHFGKNIPTQFLREKSHITREGVSITGLKQAATEIGLECAAFRFSLSELMDAGDYPCILYWNSSHFVILRGIKTSLTGSRIYKIVDPARGLVNYNEKDFLKAWLSPSGYGFSVHTEPTEKFYELEYSAKRPTAITLIKFIKPFKKEILQVIGCLLLSSLITVSLPFFSKILIDKAVVPRDKSILTVILLAQICVYLGSLLTEIVRNWLLIYIGTRVNVSIIAKFFNKILKLPIQFFETKFLGDFHQRIHDHTRIEQFLTSQSLTTLFSILNFSIFFIILANFDVRILFLYLLLTSASVFWTLWFLKTRKSLDYKKFSTSARNQEAINEMIYGVTDIKLNQFDKYKTNSWQSIQIKLFKINLSILKVDQIDRVGFEFVNQIKNIAVTYIAAIDVINGHLSLGGLLSVSYIIGQLNSPINQLVLFVKSLQDAFLSLDRLTEVEDFQEEYESDEQDDDSGTNRQFETEALHIKDLSFSYDGPNGNFILKNLNFTIPAGKTTAIVGGSGSGKTTLMKVLLKFYLPTKGEIFLGNKNLQHVNTRDWRSDCGVVMQDGFIFGETISRNIATSDEDIDYEKLHHAIKVANLSDFISSLSNGVETAIGSAGSSISGGQRQRILISRAVYKEPNYILFDEATSSLDTINEKIIHENLKDFFKNKTVVIIAHRLSTVKFSDQIVVLSEGKIVEIGTHDQLISERGDYYNLVKNQLELESA